MWGHTDWLDARAAERCAALIASLAALVLVWTRLLPLNLSLSEAEASGIEHYVARGPAGVFGSYDSGNHGLFALLTWLTTTVTRDFTTPAYRFWSVVPALAAAVVLSWWLWRRLGAWVAVTFMVLSVAAPAYRLAAMQANGYGLAFLAAALMVVATDSLLQRRTARDLLFLSAGATIGIWSLPLFGLAVVPWLGLLMTHPQLRRDALRAAAIIAFAALIFYAPVLGGVWNAAGLHFGPRLPWHGVVSRPLKELVAPVVRVLAPSLSVTAATLIAGVVVSTGILVLWRGAERMLAWVLLAPALFGYLVIELGQFQPSAHVLSFVELPLLVLAAVTIGTAGQAMLRGRATDALVLSGAVGVAVFGLIRADVSLQSLGRSTRWTPGFATQAPADNFSAAAALIDGAGVRNVVTTANALAGVDHYLELAPARALSPSALNSMLCSGTGSFAYVQRGAGPTAGMTCLEQRRAVSIRVPSAGSPMTVWFVTDRPTA